MAGQVHSDDAKAIWADVTEGLRRSLPPATFDLWLRPVRATAVRGDTLLLSAPETVRRWVERRYADRVVEAVTEREPAITAISFDAPAADREPAAGEPVPTPADPAHTFDRFVIGPGNRIAHASALRSPSCPARPTTRSSCTARPAWARPTSSARSRSTSAGPTPRSMCI